jgi:hypothetical protein
VYTGDIVTLQVGATGNPAPAYQWRKNGTDLPGQTNSQLTLSPVQLEDAGTYTVWVYNTLGSLESAAATLIVTPPPPLLIYEGFAYDQTLNDLHDVEASGLGLEGVWSQKRRGPNQSRMVEGLSFGSLKVTGNAYQFVGDNVYGSSDRFNVLSTPIAATTNATTVWSSHLVNLQVWDETQGAPNSAAPDVNWQDRMAVHNGVLGRTTAPLIGFSATRAGSLAQGRIALAGSEREGGEAVPYSETLLLIGKVTGLNTPGDAVTKRATLWVLNQEDFEAFVAAGRTEASLETHRRYTLSHEVTNNDLLSFGTHLNLHTIDWNYKVFAPIYDEIRWGLDLSSVTPVEAAVPSAPQILSHPVSRTVYASQSTTLSVGAEGVNLDYQWMHNGEEKAGASEADLILPALTEADAGIYQVIVSNPQGSATSAQAELTVLPETHSSNSANVPDLWAMQYFGEGVEPPVTVEKEGVSVPLRTVYIWGLDPGDPADVFKLGAPVLGADGSLSALNTVSGRLYRLQYSENLAEENSWQNLGEEVEGSGGVLEFPAVVPGPNRAYRVHVRIP